MTDNNDTVTPMEVLAPSAIQALERAAIDTQVATAHTYPRNLVKFRTNSLAMVTLDEETAESCIYARPVGKEKDEKTGQWVEKIAEGPSIRLAEIVGCCYGNLRVGARLVEQTPTYVKAEGVCHDLESNYAGKSEVMEATVNREGRPYSERQRAVVAKAALAKAYRDAIFKVVPRALAKPLLTAAKKIIEGADKPIEERKKRAKAWVSSLRIDNAEARVFNVLNVKSWDEMTSDHLVKLSGLKTGISEGESIDEMLPALEGAQKNAPAQTAHQQATAPAPKVEITKVEKTATVQKKDTTAEKLPKTAQEPPAGVKTPPVEEKPAVAPTAQQPDSAIASLSDEKEEADAGLAPTTTQTTEATTKEAFKPNPSESLALQSIRLNLHQGSYTETELIAVLKANKVKVTDGQKIGDLAEKKLENINAAWPSLKTQMDNNRKAPNDVATP